MDVLKIEVLEDGTIKIDSGKVSAPNHMSAESFLRDIATAGGTKQKREHKQGFIGGVRHALAHVIGAAHHH